MATDLAEALNQNPSLDVIQFVESQFGADGRPFLVLMNDGRVVNNAGVLSDALMRAARMRLEPAAGFRPPRTS